VKYLLDTNILSAFSRPQPSPSLLSWLGQQTDTSLFISSMTLAEIQRGIFQLPEGSKKGALVDWFHSSTGPAVLFERRILPFEEKAATIWADLMAQAHRSGRPRDAIDTIIAATALANNCVVVTANSKDFAGIEVLNPLG
jgi:predicted nucleic acid-binding protein